MRSYRLKFLDPLNSAIQARDFQSQDDLEALAVAERACLTHDIEIWQGDRRVARVKKGNAPLSDADHESL